MELPLNYSARRRELGSYDTIGKVHVECLPPSSLFAHFSIDGEYKGVDRLLCMKWKTLATAVLVQNIPKVFAETRQR